MYEKPRHRWEIHKLDNKSVLESTKPIPTREQRMGYHQKFISKEEHDKDVYYHPALGKRLI